MEFGVVLLTLGAYGLAIYLAMRDNTALYIVGLAAGHLSALPSPIWQLLYGFSYEPGLTPLYTLLDRPLPRAVAIAAWTICLPPLVTIYLVRRRLWFSGYAAATLAFAIFLLYHLLIELIGTGAGWWRYTTAVPLPFGLSSMLLAALMNAITSLGILSALLLTRHYAAGSLLLFLLPAPLILRLLVQGLLGAPVYTILMLHAYVPSLKPQFWAEAIGALGTLALLSWATYIVASTLARQHETAASRTSLG